MQIELKIPALGESITEVEIGQWLKREGESFAKDENVVVIESEKSSLELPAPAAGVLTKILKAKGQTATVGELIGYLDTEAVAEAKPAEPKKESPKPSNAGRRAPDGGARSLAGRSRGQRRGRTHRQGRRSAPRRTTSAAKESTCHQRRFECGTWAKPGSRNGRAYARNNASTVASSGASTHAHPFALTPYDTAPRGAGRRHEPLAQDGRRAPGASAAQRRAADHFQ
jgi:pyruvate/2-oxoglutarate dehydrogenase complex dihydrolipoamide acyltransferase (E2) component